MCTCVRVCVCVCVCARSRKRERERERERERVGIDLFVTITELSQGPALELLTRRLGLRGPGNLGRKGTKRRPKLVGTQPSNLFRALNG
jgi:hypothetical protein